MAAASSILLSEGATSTPASVCQHIDDATPSRPSRPSAWIPSALYKLFEDYDEPVKADAAETRSRPSALRRTREDLPGGANRTYRTPPGTTGLIGHFGVAIGNPHA